jgi:hypothetical protein
MSKNYRVMCKKKGKNIEKERFSPYLDACLGLA